MINFPHTAFRFLMQKFADDKRASVLPLFGILVIMLIVIAGAAVDVSRTVNAREKLSYALDAAALSVATDLSTSVMSDDEIKDALADSFRANLAGAEFLDEAIENLSFEVDSDKGLVNVASTATLNNYFIDMGGYMKEHLGPETFTFGTNSQVSYSRFDVELALVVDVTGSMSSSDMQTLREASTAVVNILLPSEIDESAAKVRLSLVPYSQGVNLGNYAEKVKGGEHHSVSGDCVTERWNFDGNNVLTTDEPYDYYSGSGTPPIESFFGGGSNKCSSSAKMMPLTKNRDELLTAISNLTDQGGTAGQTGIAWGWYSLSPNYANVWPADSAPESYDDEEVLKFAIVMTDGKNNRYYPYQDGCKWYKIKGNWKEYCDEYFEMPESETYNNVSSTRSRDLCAAMRDAGIEIFGVYFGTGSSSVGARNMQSCASDGNYYQATSSSELISAFANIAKKIQSIFISQ
ncbi:Flp pilus assembly protein TadG [Roseibium album]|nr:Flp pilus assembly protein TadG [Roseibium album]